VGTIGGIFYVVVAVALFITMCVLIYKTVHNGNLANGCKDPKNALPDRMMLLVAFGALIVGRVSGYLRYTDAWKEARDNPRSVVLGIKAFALFAGASGLALIYEAFGVAYANVPPIPSPEPITSYVRCAVVIDKTHGSGGLATYGVICVLCALVGQWLWAWHPAEELEE
jgi:hypothetical protein